MASPLGNFELDMSYLHSIVSAHGVQEVPKVKCAETSSSFQNLPWTYFPAIVEDTSIPPWTADSLLERFPRRRFRLDDNHPKKIRLHKFFEYLNRNSNGDRMPLYIFDSQCWSSRRDSGVLSKEYLPPTWLLPRCLENDMFSACPSRRRPPWRWLLLGGQRSGWGIHKDPLATSAWNTVIQGLKLWVIFPPHTPKDMLFPPSDKNAGSNAEEGQGSFVSKSRNPGDEKLAATETSETSPGIDGAAGVGELKLQLQLPLQHQEEEESGGYEWLLSVFPSIAARLPEGTWPRDCTPMACLQHPGTTIWIPAGWWHVAVNVADEPTLAVTENLALQRDLPSVAAHCVREEPGFAARLFSSPLLPPALRAEAAVAIEALLLETASGSWEAAVYQQRDPADVEQLCRQLLEGLRAACAAETGAETGAARALQHSYPSSSDSSGDSSCDERDVGGDLSQ